jgi:hypothetical protein
MALFATTLVFHFLLLAPILIYSSPVEDPELVVQEVQKYVMQYFVNDPPPLSPFLCHTKFAFVLFCQKCYAGILFFIHLFSFSHEHLAFIFLKKNI